MLLNTPTSVATVAYKAITVWDFHLPRANWAFRTVSCGEAEQSFSEGSHLSSLQEKTREDDGQASGRIPFPLDLAPSDRVNDNSEYQ